MHRKNKNFGVGFIIAPLIMTAILSIGWYASQPRSEVLASNANVASPVQQQFDLPKNSELQALSEPRSKTINDITVELTSAKIIKTGIEMVICYTTPDGGDWYTTPGSISFSTYEIFADEAELLNEQKADEKNTGKRCEAIRYRIDEPDTISTPIRFSVLSFWAVPKELLPCENLQQRLDTSPKAKTYGLKVNCSYDEQTGLSVVLADKLPSIAQSEAQQVLDEIIKGEVFGPWDFTITELKK